MSKNVIDANNLFLVKQGKKIPTTTEEVEVFEKAFADEIEAVSPPPLEWTLELARKIKGND